MIAILKAAMPAHIRQNATTANLGLNADDLWALDQVFPSSTRKRNLAVV